MCYMLIHCSDIPENKEEMLKSQLPDQPVQITLDAPIDFFQKKRK